MLFRNLAIIIFGHSLQTINLFKNGFGPKNQDWYYLVWGDPKTNQLGRASKGILLALQNQTQTIVFGTGATWIHLSGDVITRKEYDLLDTEDQSEYISEAEYTMEYVFSNFEKLMDFPALKFEINRFTKKTDGAKEFIKSISLAENNSFNTGTLIKQGIKKISDNSQLVDNLCLVSNPSHLYRILKLAILEYRLTKKSFSDIIPICCDTDFAITGETPIIFEPHSGPSKRPNPFPTDVFNEFSLLPIDRQESCLQEMQKLISKFSI